MTDWGDLRSAAHAGEWDRALELAGSGVEARAYVRVLAAHSGEWGYALELAGSSVEALTCVRGQAQRVAVKQVHREVRAAIDAGDWRLAILWARESAVARSVAVAAAAQLDAEERLADVVAGSPALEWGPLSKLRVAWAVLLVQRLRSSGDGSAFRGVALGAIPLAQLERAWAESIQEGQWMLEATRSKALTRRMEAARVPTGARLETLFERRETLVVRVTTAHPELWLHLAKPARRARWAPHRKMDLSSWLILPRSP